MRRRYIFTPACPEELFTDREDELAMLWRLGANAALRRTTSTALIGLRRLGKTELFKRIHGKLFFEQNEVTPIFFSYQGQNLTGGPLAEEYLLNFLRQYFAFTRGKNLRYLEYDLGHLLHLCETDAAPVLGSITRRFQNSRRDGQEGDMLTAATEAPRTVADALERPIVIFLDEFERVLEVRNRDGTDPSALGKYQVAVESLWCPHVITGSAMTLILRDIIGAGPLYGRFFTEYIRGLHPVYGAELARKVAAFNEVSISEEMAGHLAERTDGNPFYVRAVVSQAARLGVRLDGPGELNRAIATDLIRGAIYSELWQQVTHFVMGQNQYGVRSELITFLAEYPMGARIGEKDMQRFGEQAGLAAVETRALFAALARADLVEEDSLRIGYSAVRDPLLNEFLRLWVRMEREGVPRRTLLREKLQEYQRRVKRMDDFKGYFAERLVELLMTKWRDEVVDGEMYFGVVEEVTLPHFIEVGKERLKVREKPAVEMDVVGWRMGEAWVIESRYWKDKMGLGEVQTFEERGEVAREALKVDEMRLWYFSKAGFTEEAKGHMRERGILHSDAEQLDDLLQRFGLRKLPEM